MVKVSNRSSADNRHYLDLQTISNDVRKAEKAYFFDRKCNPKSLLTATTLAGPSIKRVVLGGYIL